MGDPAVNGMEWMAVCPVCGARVDSATTHREWHTRQDAALRVLERHLNALGESLAHTRESM